MRGETCIDILAFWQGMRARVPKLSDLALQYLSIPVNSVDAERSFSAYNNIVSDKRHNLSDANTKMLLKMYYNSAVDASASVVSEDNASDTEDD